MWSFKTDEINQNKHLQHQLIDETSITRAIVPDDVFRIFYERGLVCNFGNIPY